MILMWKVENSVTCKILQHGDGCYLKYSCNNSWLIVSRADKDSVNVEDNNLLRAQVLLPYRQPVQELIQCETMRFNFLKEINLDNIENPKLCANSV